MGFRRLVAILILLACIVCARAASAAVIMLGTAPGTTAGGKPVSAIAKFTTSANQVIVLLSNLQPDPDSVVQCLSGLQFTVSTGQSSGTLASSSGIERTITDTGTYSDGASAATGWELSTEGASLKLDLLPTATAPEHTIIGPPNASNLYPSGNGSIDGGSHNPFMGESATFTITVPGVTAGSSISDAIFQFNTAGKTTANAVTVPEPGSALFLLLCAGVFARRQNHRTSRR